MQQLACNRFDAVVIGGGIQGLTFAEEAGRRNKRVAVLEAGEFGAGSTAASLGIVHGGFRYWQELDAARLVRSRREQAWFLQNFAGLVRPLRCVLPFYRRNPATPALFAAAAAADRAVRAYVGGAVRALPAPRLIGRRALLDEAPWLQEQPVFGAGEWHDLELVDLPGLIDALLGRAADRRAACLTGTEVSRINLDASGEVAGVDSLRRDSGDTVRFDAPIVVNCSGAALLTLSRAVHPDVPRFFEPLRAYNVVVRSERPLSAAFAVGRGKRLFLRPSPGGLMAGTFYGAHPDLDGWMRALDAAAPGLSLERAGSTARILAGVVPAGPTGTTPASRDVILDHGAAGGPRGLFSLSGVKLTTARWLSAQAAARIWPGASRAANRAFAPAVGAVS